MEGSLAPARPAPVLRALESILEGVLALTLVAQVVIVVLNVLLRSFFHYSFVWANETAGAALTLVGFIGGALAYRRRLHMSVIAISSRLPPMLRLGLEAGSDWLVFAISGLILHASLAVVANHAHEISPMLGVSTFWFVLPLPIGMALLMLFALLRIAEHPRRIALAAGAAIAVAVAAAWWTFPAWGPGLPAGAPLAAAIVLFFGLTLLGLPVGFALAGGTIGYLFAQGSSSYVGLPSMMLSGVDLFVLLALPFFILAGAIMEKGGISERLVEFIGALVGHLRGGLLHVTVLSMYVVSGMSGAKTADVAAVGGVMCDMLRREGYSSAESVAVLASSAVMGETVPPSIAMLVLASITSISVAALFVAGLLPAAFVALCLGTLVYVNARRSGLQPRARASWGTIGRAALRALLPLMMPIILFGGIILGIATPTEVSSFAVAYGLVLAGLVYRHLDLPGLIKMVVHASLVTGMLLFVVGAAGAFAYVLTISNLPQQLTALLTSIHAGTAVFFVVSILVLTVMGTLLEGLPALLIFGPLLLPVAQGLQIDPLHFAVVIIIAMGIGLFAPPFGIGFYVACAVGNSTIEGATKATLPYLAVVALGLIVVAAVPWLTLAVPRAFHMGAT